MRPIGMEMVQARLESGAFTGRMACKVRQRVGRVRETASGGGGEFGASENPAARARRQTVLVAHFR
jgi:hypothetical protein